MVFFGFHVAGQQHSAYRVPHFDRCQSLEYLVRSLTVHSCILRNYHYHGNRHVHASDTASCQLHVDVLM
jgi:hypothetical protein